MKTKLFFSTLFTLIIWNVQAQMGVIALHKVGEVQYFSTSDAFNLAYTAAVDGDTLYLPGGTFNPPPVFRKNLKIFGVGHYPDSTAATNATIISTNFTIGHEADGLHLEGLKIMGQVIFEVNAATGIQNVVMRRCYLQNLVAQGTVVHNNNLFTENVFLQISELSAIQASGFYSNIIENRIYNIYYNVFENNIFLFHAVSGYVSINNAQSSVFNNNVFENFGVADGNANSFSNNLIGGTAALSLGTNPSMNSNYRIDPNDTYLSETNQLFEYADNFHLTATALGVLGDDGSQVGIYGGIFPYKEGAVPITPHISVKNIANTSNNQGKIEVEIEVHSQNR
jgi:hypothetical protein